MIVCTICARGGSKGIPNKNIRPIAGKPLLAHTLEFALNYPGFQAVGVSSDSEEILRLAQSLGAQHLVRRPPEMATDQAGKVPAIQHCAQTLEKSLGRECTYIVDLDVTSPLRSKSDVDGVLDLLRKSGSSNVVTGMSARRSPYFNLVELDPRGVVHLSKAPLKPILRRQDAPACFDLNASVFAWSRRALFEDPKVFYDDTRLFEMPEERSIDIDSEMDFGVVEMLLLRRKGG